MKTIIEGLIPGKGLGARVVLDNPTEEEVNAAVAAVVMMTGALGGEVVVRTEEDDAPRPLQ